MIENGTKVRINNKYANAADDVPEDAALVNQVGTVVPPSMSHRPIPFVSVHLDEGVFLFNEDELDILEEPGQGS
jgi:hypothetical protein